MSKNTYRINESQLRGLIAESIKRALNEDWHADWYEKVKKGVFSTCEPISADEFFQMISGITSERDLMSEIGNFCYQTMEDYVEDEGEDGIHCNWTATDETDGIRWGACGVSEVTYYKNDQGDYWTPPYFDVEFGDIDIEEGWVSYNGKVADIKGLILGYIR